MKFFISVLVLSATEISNLIIKMSNFKSKQKFLQAFLTFLYSKSGTETGNESNACDVISRAREIDTSQHNTNNIAQWLIAFLIHTPPMEDIHFLDPLPWNSTDVDEFPSYPLEFRNFLQISSHFNEFLLIPWKFHRWF
jgi:hypothetical protein